MYYSNLEPNIAKCDFIDFPRFKDCNILLTGATGLIGKSILKYILPICEKLNLKIYALVRDINKAKELLSKSKHLLLVEGNIINSIDFDFDIDYIIHGASITKSSLFIKNPVETILTTVTGTQHMLELAIQKNVKSMVYLSSMEVYGTLVGDNNISEDVMGYINPLSIRSCYPQGKRTAESLCSAYASEYGVNIRIARLAQTFGPEIPNDDNRVFSQFIKQAKANKNIEIKTEGNSSRMYLFTFDAVTAIFSLLLKGENGQAYNIADKHTFSSIAELARLIKKVLCSKSEVITGTGTKDELSKYPPDSFLYLDTSLLEDLGWRPMISMEDGLSITAQSLEG